MWPVQTEAWTAARLSSVEVGTLNSINATRVSDFLKRRLWVLEWIILEEVIGDVSQ